MSFRATYQSPHPSLGYSQLDGTLWKTSKTFSTARPGAFHKEYRPYYYSNIHPEVCIQNLTNYVADPRPLCGDKPILHPNRICHFSKSQPKEHARKYQQLAERTSPANSSPNAFPTAQRPENKLADGKKIVRSANMAKRWQNVKIVVTAGSGVREVITAKESPRVLAEKICESEGMEGGELEMAVEYYLKKSLARKLKFVNYSYYPDSSKSFTKP
eukprot:TRINITY_DN15227_c0_g1_i1.p1 TRINITY_DN15227_c0_g1~~TRINITY_DN15227_c0_g1_i1.p1  ORF type:complete len:215 (+),score=19.27 TRINITY_DN15227_c0_g1_i1:135-779(+)